MTNKITDLSAEQRAAITQAQEEWLSHGLSTQPANRAEAEAGIREAYTSAGLKPPRTIIWVDSPFAGAIAQAMILYITKHIQQKIMEAEAATQVLDLSLLTNELANVSGWWTKAEFQHTHTDRFDRKLHDDIETKIEQGIEKQVHDKLTQNIADQINDAVERVIDDTVDDAVFQNVSTSMRSLATKKSVYDQLYHGLREQVINQIAEQIDFRLVSLNTDPPVTVVPGRIRAGIGDKLYTTIADKQNDYTAGEFVKDAQRIYAAYLNTWYQARMAGQHWAGYYCFYDALKRIGVTGLELPNGQMRVARNAGWWWCYQDFVVITERPNQLHLDVEGRLHHNKGPAISYPDGWGIWAWHGVNVEPWVIDGTASIEKILKIVNTEVRRCAVEARADRDGWDGLIKTAGWPQVGKTVADPGNPGQTLSLYHVKNVYAEPVNLLKMVNGTIERDGTRREFGETVPARIKDPIEAAAWQIGLSKADYVQTVRRT